MRLTHVADDGTFEAFVAEQGQSLLRLAFVLTGERHTAEDLAAGTRLLVSGEPRWGGTPMTAAIAWGCGFTRYYDPGTAAQWAGGP